LASTAGWARLFHLTRWHTQIRTLLTSRQGTKKHSRKIGVKEVIVVPFNIIRKRKIGRRVFGFPCTPEIKIVVLAMARRIGVPNYVLCEHLLQLAAAQISIDLEDPESERELKEHLISSHLLQPVLAENEYDGDAVKRAKKTAVITPRTGEGRQGAGGDG